MDQRVETRSFADPRMIGRESDGGAMRRVEAEVARLGLEQNTRELDERGYTVLRPDQVAPEGFAAGLRDRIFACSEAIHGVRPDVVTGQTHTGPMQLGSGEILTEVLFADPVFEQALMTPSILALASYLLGESCILAAINGVIKGPGNDYVPLHCDAVIPDPFPPFEQVCNATWLLTDFDVANGGTLFVPGSNRKQRHPRDEESTDVTTAEPLIAPAGSVAIWGGNIWHGALPRTAPGLRVSMLTIFHRYYMRVPHMSFMGKITREMLDRNPERFAYLTGVTTNETREYLTRTSRFV